MSRDADAYRSVRTAVIALARSHGDDLDRPSPATPEWRARDVIAHLAGVCDDVVHGNLTDVGSDPWTAVQVEKRRGWSVAELLGDWERNGDAVDTLIDSAPPGTFGQLLFDAWTHEQDVRCALACPGGRDSVAAELAFAWAHLALDGRDRGDGRAGLALVVDGSSSLVGTPPAATTLHVSRFELLRAMTGRRSVAQMRDYRWDGDPQPERLVLAAFFTPPADPLIE